MPKFAANLTMLFADLPVVERFAAARAAGFDAVELLFPYDDDVDAIEQALQDHNLRMILFNVPVGDFAAGERGIANAPQRVEEFRAGAQMAVDLAGRYSTPQLNCLVGKWLGGTPQDEQRQTLVENLRFAAGVAAEAGVLLLVEPLNTIDTPGFLIATAQDGLDLIDEVGHPNLHLQFDVYHEQRMAGNLVATIREHRDRIAHIQIADSPARNQPGTGEINYRYVLDEIDAAGYDGYVSLEFVPAPDTTTALDEMKAAGLLTLG